ncbi:hypothetical protein ACHAPA_007091 [Fusarium lateritium]
MSSPPQIPSQYAPEAPPLFQGETLDYESLLKNMPGNNEVLLACLLALIAVVALLALAIVFVFIMARREAAAREKEQSMYSEVFAAIKDAMREAAAERKKDVTEKAESREASTLAPDNSLPGSETWARSVMNSTETIV